MTDKLDRIVERLTRRRDGVGGLADAGMHPLVRAQAEAAWGALDAMVMQWQQLAPLC